MAPTEPGDAVEVYILGEAPGAEEDKRGRQFVGKSGQLLRDALRRAFGNGFVEEHVAFDNSVRCRPPGNRTPTTPEIEHCRPLIEESIVSIKPKLLLLVGGTPLFWAIRRHSPIRAWHGELFPVEVRGHACWAYCVFHPAFILRTARRRTGRLSDVYEDTYGAQFLFDLKALAAMRPLWRKRPTVEDLEPKDLELVVPRRARDVERALEPFADGPAAVDLETQADVKGELSMRPAAPGARIVSFGVSDGRRAAAVLLSHAKSELTERELRKALRAVGRFVARKGAVRVAHNLTFDLAWLMHHCGGLDLANAPEWHDTGVMAYVLNERRGGSKNALTLDAVCQLALGRAGKLQHSMDMASLGSAPVDDLLRYNATDAFVTLRAWRALRRRVRDEGLWDVYRLTAETAVTSACISNHGVRISRPRLRKFKFELEAHVEDVVSQIYKTKEARKFKRVVGRPLRPSSNDDLALLFTRVCPSAAVIEHAERVGKVQVNEAALTQAGTELASLVLKYRGLTKLLSTYIVGTEQLIFPDGRVHPSVNVTVTATGRLSFDTPNLQNFPKRKDAWVRNIVVPDKGNVLVAIDYSAIEAKVIAMASGSRKFMEFLWSGKDVHLYWTHRLIEMYPRILDWVRREFSLDGSDEKKVLMTLRREMKNRWVFPQFYGAKVESCAKYLSIPRRVAEALAEEFWDAYNEVLKWQRRQDRDYRRHGYVQMLTGRRRHGPMSRGEYINAPIQGTASDIVTHSSNRLRRKRIVPAMNVHDDLTFELPDDDQLEDRIRRIARVMCCPRFDFINVPIEVEVSIGKRWGEMKEVLKFHSYRDFGFPEPPSWYKEGDG